MRIPFPRPDGDAETLEAVLDRYLVSGDEEAMERVVAATRPRLLGAARRIGKPQDAEDSVQAAYLSLVRKRGEPLEAPVVPWLLTAVIRIAYRRKALDRREQEIAQRLALPRGLPAPDAEAMSAEESARLWREVARLPEKYRDPVVLHHLHGVPTPEVARLLDLPEATVRTRLHRGRGLLRTRLPVGLALGLMAGVWFLLDAGKAGGGFAAAAMGGVMTTGGALGVGVIGAVLGAVIGAKLLGGASPAEQERLVKAEEAVTAARSEIDEMKGRLDRVNQALDEAQRKAAAAERENGTLRADVAALQEKATAAAEATGESAKPATEKPVAADPSLRFSFGEYDAALKEVDWGKVGTNTRAMVPLIQELLAAARDKTPIPGEALGKVQQHNGALVAVAFQMKDKLPGTGLNGTFTHPAFMVNSMAATLEAAGLPLSAEQAEALGRLGRDFTDRDRARTSGYDESTYMLTRVLEEAEMKDRFFEQAFALLTTEQADALSPPASRGLVSLDLYSSGLMLAQVLRPASGKDRETFLKALGDAFVSGASFPADRRTDLDQVIKSWGADLPEAWFTEETTLLVGVQPIWSVARAEEVGRRELVLLKRVVDELGVSEDVAAALRGSGVIMMPLVRPSK